MKATSTPLWFYLLAEAQLSNGPLGKGVTTLVAATLWNLIKHSPHSALNDNPVDVATEEYTLKGIISLGIAPKIAAAA